VRPRIRRIVPLLCAVAAACASPPEARMVLQPLQEGDTSAARGFESPPILNARDLLPPDLVSGPHHEVDETVATDGFRNLYTITSELGSFEAHGDDMLRIRVREIEALAALREMSTRREFTTAVANALKSPFVATWNLITHPVDSITGLPVGAWNHLKRTTELAKGERGEFEDSALREFIGFESKKREIAYRLGVDPYSSNKELQKRLNRFAWVSFVGELPAIFVPFRGDAEPGDETAPAAPGDRMGEILLDYSPEDLRRLNRIEMAVMGIPEQARDAFIGHAWFSPRHQTVLVESLAALDLAAGRADFIEVAMRASSENDALFYQRVAEMMRSYHENVAPIERLVAFGGAVAGYTSDHRLVVPLAVDYAVWTRPTAEFTQSLAAADFSDVEVETTELLLSGRLSPKARARIESLGLTVTERAFETLDGDDEAGADAP
jgi:hypothetical protein